MKNLITVLGGFLIATSIAGAQAATGTIASTPNGSNFDYTIKLTNTGTTTLDVFWFSWDINDYNFMPTAPTSISSPTGWSGTSTTDFFHGYGIEWLTTTAPLAIGATDTFLFTSATTPTQMLGSNATFGLPVTYSTVYSGVAQASPFGVINALTPVPEPTTYAGLGLGLGALLIRKRRKI